MLLTTGREPMAVSPVRNGPQRAVSSDAQLVREFARLCAAASLGPKATAWLLQAYVTSLLAKQMTTRADAMMSRWDKRIRARIARDAKDPILG